MARFSTFLTIAWLMAAASGTHALFPALLGAPSAPLLRRTQGEGNAPAPPPLITVEVGGTPPPFVLWAGPFGMSTLAPQSLDRILLSTSKAFFAVLPVGFAAELALSQALGKVSPRHTLKPMALLRRGSRFAVRFGVIAAAFCAVEGLSREMRNRADCLPDQLSMAMGGLAGGFTAAARKKLPMKIQATLGGGCAGFVLAKRSEKLLTAFQDAFGRARGAKAAGEEEMREREQLQRDLDELDLGLRWATWPVILLFGVPMAYWATDVSLAVMHRIFAGDADDRGNGY